MPRFDVLPYVTLRYVPYIYVMLCYVIFKLIVSYQFLFMNTILLCLISKAGRSKHRMCGKMRCLIKKGV